jgi:hypothetical protein
VRWKWGSGDTTFYWRRQQSLMKRQLNFDGLKSVISQKIQLFWRQFVLPKICYLTRFHNPGDSSSAWKLEYFVDPRANAKLVPKFHGLLYASHAALSNVDVNRPYAAETLLEVFSPLIT